MDLLESLDAEVSQLVDDMPVEIIFALMDKWDHDFEQLARVAVVTLDDRLNHYVRLKIAWGKVRRRLEWEWSHDTEPKFTQQESYYNNKIREARRNYYVAKRRVEGKHASGCSCRGCRCLKGIS